MIKHQNLLWNFFLAEHTNFQYLNPIFLNLQFLIRLNKIFYRSIHLKSYKVYVRKLYKHYALIFVCVIPYGIKNKFSLFPLRCPINFHLKKKEILQRFKLLLFLKYSLQFYKHHDTQLQSSLLWQSSEIVQKGALVSLGRAFTDSTPPALSPQQSLQQELRLQFRVRL